jgi:hypothetical protein
MQKKNERLKAQHQAIAKLEKELEESRVKMRLDYNSARLSSKTDFLDAAYYSGSGDY